RAGTAPGRPRADGLEHLARRRATAAAEEHPPVPDREARPPAPGALPLAAAEGAGGGLPAGRSGARPGAAAERAGASARDPAHARGAAPAPRPPGGPARPGAGG